MTTRSLTPHRGPRPSLGGAHAVARRRCDVCLHAFAIMVVFQLSGGIGVLAQSAVINSSSAGYTLAAWTAQAGLPSGDVIAITQDLDGYLWLGTSTGLLRFDGAEFTARETLGQTAPREDRVVSSLVGSRDGSLWVGRGGHGGVARIYMDRVTSYGEPDGLFAGPVASLLEDRDGTIWAGGRGGLARFRHGQWEHIGTRGDYGGAEVHSIYQDRTGRLWLGTSAGVYVGTNEVFELRFPGQMFVQDFVEDLHNTLWVTDTRETIKPLDGSGSLTRATTGRPPQSGWRLAMDRRGQVWIAALGGGLLRLAGHGLRPGAIERFLYEGKIGGAPLALFFDRDGDLWVGLRGGGLMRVSEQSIAGNVPLDGLTNDGVRAVAAGTGSSVWVATGHSLNRFVGTSRQVFPLSQTRALSTDHNGTLWIATAGGVGHLENGRFVSLTLPADIIWERVSAITSDATDGRWLCSSAQGIMLWRNGALFRFDDVPKIHGKACSDVYSDRRGRQWIGFAGGGIAVRGGASTELYTEADGLAGGGVLAILEDRSGDIWVTTRSGVSRFHNGRFTTLTEANGPFVDLIAALVEGDDGYVWVGVNGGAAIVRFLASEMDKVAVNALRLIEYTLYDASDGMQGKIQWQQTRAGAVRGPDGRLWFATGLGLAVVDPHNLPKSRRPMLPRIEQVVADGRALSPIPSLELPAGVSNLTVHWGTVSLKSATKLRFRYRLEGYEPNWVAAGARRSSFVRASSVGSVSLPGQHHQRRDLDRGRLLGVRGRAAVLFFPLVSCARRADDSGAGRRSRVATGQHDAPAVFPGSCGACAGQPGNPRHTPAGFRGHRYGTGGDRPPARPLAERQPRVPPAVAAPGGALARRSSRSGRGAPSERDVERARPRGNTPHTVPAHHHHARRRRAVHEQRSRRDALFRRCRTAAPAHLPGSRQQCHSSWARLRDRHHPELHGLGGRAHGQ